MTEQNTITQLNYQITDLRDQLDYYQGLTEKANCYRCPVKEVEFPTRVKKVGDQIRINTIYDIMSTLRRHVDGPSLDLVLAVIDKHFVQKYDPVDPSPK